MKRPTKILLVEVGIALILGAILWTKLGDLPVEDLQLGPECYGERVNSSQ